MTGLPPGYVTMVRESTIEPKPDIALFDPEIVALSVEETDVLSLPKEAVAKFGRAYRHVTEPHEEGTSVIHSAEFRKAPGTADEVENDLLVETSLMLIVNFAVFVEYFTVADISLPG